MIPAIPTSLDAAFWLVERGGAEGLSLDPNRLEALLYLAQRHFAAANDGARLMPAVFVANAEGPSEPNVRAVLASGLQQPWRPRIEGRAASFLKEFWRRIGRLPAPAIKGLIANDEAWIRAVEKAPGSEIMPLTKSNKPQKKLEHQPIIASKSEIPLFTGDGRSVRKWRPVRRLPGPGEPA